MRKLITVVLFAFVILFVLVTAGVAAAGTSYTFTHLTLGGSGSYAYGINNAGQVVGSSLTTGNAALHAFLYSVGTMTDLGTLGGRNSVAYGINNAGQVVGHSFTVGSSSSHAFLYSGGTMTDLGTLGGNYSWARGINDAGQVVGHSYINGYQTHAFLYSGGTMTDLTPDAYQSYAYGINSAGQVVGHDGSPFLYSGGTMTHIVNNIGGAYDINDAGQVVGSVGSISSHAFLYSGGTMTDLGTLGGKDSIAYGINNAGQVVGVSYIIGDAAATWHAFLYSGGTMTDLNQVVPELFGWMNTYAFDINDAGQIVGYGTTPSGATHAFLLTPAPPVAKAGSGQTVHVGRTVILDGSGSSDPGGSTLTYQWSFVLKPAGSGASLSDPTIVNPTFTSDVQGDYILQLIVTNSAGNVSSPSTVTISTTNSPPVADAGADQLVTIIGTNVQLNGSQSYDPDGDAISYSWTLSSPAGSKVSLIGANTVAPTFYPDVYGTYMAHLVVSDPWALSQTSTVTISFDEVKPVANAQQSGSIPVSTVAFLDGTNSSDANHDPLTYMWTFVSLPANSQSVISSPTANIASFIPDVPGTYIAQLIVNDGIMNSDPSTVQFQVYSTETAAIAAATDIQASVSSIPAIALKNANMKKTFLNQLNAVIASIDAGLYADALGQLKNDILGKTDGCATTGAPDKNDWITTCPEQNQVYPLIQETIWIVEGLLPQ